MVLKVRLTRGVETRLVGGSLCNQCVCVVSFITSKLPCSSMSSTFSMVCLCLKANFRSAPKLSEPIAPSFLDLFRHRCAKPCLHRQYGRGLGDMN